MAPQLIGASITSGSANDWQSYDPATVAASSYQGATNAGASSAGTGAGNFLGGATAGVAGLLAGGNAYNPSNAATIQSIQSAPNNTLGNIQKGVGAASLAYGGLNKLTGGATANSTIGGGLGALGGGLQFINGIQQGGVMGYGNAAVGGLRAAAGVESMMGNSNLAGTLGGAAGYIAAPLALYSAIKNWQSGATASDALQGAEAGAAIGSIIPGVGTLIGGVVGGAIGAVSSAFGNGRVDPETNNWQSFINATKGATANPQQVAQMTSTQNMSPQQSFNLLAGVMDIKDGRIPITNAFGQKSEGALVSQMTSQVNSAIKSGKISASATPQQMFSQVVTPWLNSKGATIGPETGGLQLQGVLTNLLGHWQNGTLTDDTVLTSGGSKDTTIPTFGG